jgi:hypothetical protein
MGKGADGEGSSERRKSTKAVKWASDGLHSRKVVYILPG